MRTIQFESINTKVVHVNSLPEMPIIGFVTSGCRKGWLQLVSNEDNNSLYTMLIRDGGVRRGNHLTPIRVNQLGWILNFCRTKKLEVFEFDNEIELFAWLAKD